MSQPTHSRALPGQLALRHLSRSLDLLLGAGAGLFLAAGLGILLAVYLRRHHLGWTWALLSLVPPLLLIPLIGATSAPDGLAVIAAAVCLGLALGSLGWGLGGELEDRRAGGDRQTRAAERRGLLDGLRQARAERRDRLGELLGSGLPIGRTSRGELALIGRGSAASGRHVLIPGATGAGKTTSLAALLVDYISRSGFGAVVLEAKADAVLRDSAERAARARGCTFHLLSPSGPSTYDPLAHGSVDERSERLIAVESWGSSDAGFYRQAASPFLRLVLRTLDRSSEPVTLATVARYCDPDELENLALSLSEPDADREVQITVRGLRSDQQRAIAGLRARLQNLATSEFAGRWLDPQRAGAQTFDLRGAIERREVVYFRFDTDRTGNVGRAIAQMLLLDLGAAASALMGEGVGTFVAIDEFGALEAPALDRLYARGRAAGFSVAVGTQTLADLRAAGPAVRERIGATVSAIICHRIGEQADAEWVAELIGAIPTWQTTIRTDGLGRPSAEGTRTRGYRFEVNPSELQRLGPGEACIARLEHSGPSRAQRCRVVPPWRRLPVVPPSPPTVPRFNARAERTGELRRAPPGAGRRSAR